MIVKFLLFFLLLLLQIAACASSTLKFEKIPVEASGWLGADGAYSVQKDSNQAIWVFSDSYLGNLINGKRVDGKIVRNSIAIEHGNQYQYYWGSNKSAFFKNKRKNEWYWPSDLFIYRDSLFVFLKRVQQTNPQDPLGFKVMGNDLAIIKNYKASPQEWRIKYKALPFSELVLGVATAVQSDFLYLLADKQNKGHSLYLGRIHLDKLNQTNIEIEFYSQSSLKWLGSYKNISPIFPIGSPEASLRYDKTKSRWRVVFSPKGLSKKIVKVEATEIIGPWSSFSKIFSCNEMSWNPKYFCYSAKEIAGDPFRFTYNVNSFDFWDLSRDSRIYVPRVLSLDID